MKTFVKSYWPSILSGIALALSFPSASQFYLGWFALVPLFVSCENRNAREAAGRFFLTAWIFYSIVLQWLLANYFWAGGWALAGQQILCAYLSLYWLLLAVAWKWTSRALPKIPSCLTLPILWVCMEYLQARLLSGFPWAALGYSQSRNLMVLQLASIGGVSFISAILIISNALFAKFVRPPRWKTWRRPAAALAIIIAAHAGGCAMLAEPEYADEPFKVGLFQPNFPLEMKWDSEYCVDMTQNAASKTRALAANADIDLMIWPETLIMTEISEPEIEQIVTKLTRDTGAWLFTGVHKINPETQGDQNSSCLINPDGDIAGHYNKRHLAPFGEYLPFAEYLPFILDLVPIISDLEPGTHARVFDIDGKQMGPMICFEVAFAGISEELCSLDSDFLVVITNLGWFGASSALEQELEISRMRAVETRLPVAHASNTGISGVFDPWGRFSMMNAYAWPDGGFMWLSPDVEAEQTAHERCLGAFSLPEPHERLLPFSPGAFSQLATIAASVLMLVTLAMTLRRRKKRGRQ